MAAPLLALASKSYVASSTFDLSALTGGASYAGVEDGALAYTILGALGADYFWVKNQSATYFKAEGGSQLNSLAPFNDSGSAVSLGVTNYSATLTFNPLECNDIGASVPNQSAGVYNFPSGQINCGAKWGSTIIADQSHRKLTFIGSNGGGTYEVNASLSDGSYQAQSLILPSGNSWFTVDFIAAAPNSHLNLEIRCTSAPSATFLIPFCMWLGVPVAPPYPRAFGGGL